MEEKSILHTINGLVDEEHQLRAAAQAGKITSDEERTRLHVLEESLDQCWDLLRRRRAAQANHQSPENVQARPINEVEGYLQ